ncbi:MAG: methyltransferase domain-containing protein [Halobacteriaceae archaeon]
MARPDPLGRAMLDYQRGDYGTGDLQYRDGERSERGRVAGNYFGEAAASPWKEFVEGPVVDVGCGAGRDALWFQERHQTLATDASARAVRAARERGVERVAATDMFGLALPDGAVRSVYCVGTQAGLSGSLVGLSRLLSEFARVTDAGGRAVVDAHDPDRGEDLFGYRADPRPGLARRAFHFEYRGETGRALLFLLASPDRFREAAAATEWTVEDVSRKPEGPHYALLLAK